MSLHKDRIISVKQNGKELKHHLKDIPRIGEHIFLPNKNIYKVVRVLYYDDWYNSHSIYHQVDIIVRKEAP